MLCNSWASNLPSINMYFGEPCYLCQLSDFGNSLSFLPPEFLQNFMLTSSQLSSEDLSLEFLVYRLWFYLLCILCTILCNLLTSMWWLSGIDTIGGIRLPAAYCGVLGFRPSYGAIVNTGVLPVSPSLDSIGTYLFFIWLPLLLNHPLDISSYCCFIDAMI